MLNLKTKLIGWWIKRDQAFEQNSGYTTPIDTSNVSSLLSYRTKKGR